MDLRYLCALKVVEEIRNRRFNIKVLDLIPLNCKNQILKILSKYDKNSHQMKYNNCLAEIEILLCNDCDQDIKDVYLYQYDELLTLYYNDRIKCIRSSSDNNYGLYCNILNNKTWLNNKYYQNVIKKII